MVFNTLGPAISLLLLLRECMLSRFSHVSLFATVACQAPLSLGILQARILGWVPCSLPGDLPDPGIEPTSLMSPAVASGSCTNSATWEAQLSIIVLQNNFSPVAVSFLYWLKTHMHFLTNPLMCSHCVLYFQSKGKTISQLLKSWVTLQAPLFVWLSRQEYWSGLPFPSPKDLPNPGIEAAHLLH